MSMKKIFYAVIVALFALCGANAKEKKAPEWVQVFNNTSNINKVASSLNLPKSTQIFIATDDTGKSEKETLQRAKINAFGDCVTSFIQVVSANVIGTKTGEEDAESYICTSVSGFYLSEETPTSATKEIISPFGTLKYESENGVVKTDSVSDTDKELLNSDFFKMFTDGDKVKLYTYTTKAKNADKSTTYTSYVALAVSEETQKEISDFLKLDESENKEAQNALQNAIRNNIGL